MSTSDNTETPEVPAGHFVDNDPSRPVPLVVLEATGEPAFALVSGRLVPYATYRTWSAAAPRTPPPPRAFALQAGNGTFAGTIEVR